MSFAPQEQSNGPKKDFPKIKGGEEGVYSLPARISVLVDLGVQERDAFQEKYDENNQKHKDSLGRDKNPATLEEIDGTTYINLPQFPVRQVVLFADLVTERVDYGEKIGEKPFRIMLNKSFQGKINGTALTVSKSRDTKGKIIEDSPKTFHQRSLLAQLGKACGVSFVKNGNDISELAGKAFAATVENKSTKAGGIFTKFNSASPLMEGMQVPELDEEPLLVTFESATAEQIKFLWRPVIETIKRAQDYEGSQIQKAIQEFESQSSQQSSDEQGEGKTAEDYEEDVPF